MKHGAPYLPNHTFVPYSAYTLYIELNHNLKNCEVQICYLFYQNSFLICLHFEHRLLGRTVKENKKLFSLLCTCIQQY